MMTAFKDNFEASGGTILGEEYTPFRKTKDFGPYLARVKESGADAVYVFYAGGEAINFIKQAHSFGLSSVMKLRSRMDNFSLFLLLKRPLRLYW